MKLLYTIFYKYCISQAHKTKSNEFQTLFTTIEKYTYTPHKESSNRAHKHYTRKHVLNLCKSIVVRPRKPEMIIRENQPKELPPDVVRGKSSSGLQTFYDVVFFCLLLLISVDFFFLLMDSF